MKWSGIAGLCSECAVVITQLFTVGSISLLLLIGASA